MNLFHKDKLRISITTLTPYSVCRNICGKIYAKSGFGIGFSAMTTYLLTAFPVHEFMARNNMTVIPLSLLTRFNALWLLSFTKTQDGVKGNEV
jgi:hypothetical protein